MVYSMKYDELFTWVKNKAQPGDVAVCTTKHDNRQYFYEYHNQDQHPYWKPWQDDVVGKYIAEIDKLKVADATVNKRCENCKYFKSISVKDIAMGNWCEHEEHRGMYVPKFVSCPEYEPKEKKSTPFDGVKFYLIDDKSGELGLKYVCEDCGKLMDEPGHWWLALPLRNIDSKQTRAWGYHFRCEECDKNKEGKV